MDRLIDEYDKSFREQDDPEAIQRQRDVEILSSIPGVGRIVLAPRCWQKLQIFIFHSEIARN